MCRAATPLNGGKEPHPSAPPLVAGERWHTSGPREAIQLPFLNGGRAFNLERRNQLQEFQMTLEALVIFALNYQKSRFSDSLVTFWSRLQKICVCVTDAASITELSNNHFP